MRYLVSGKEMKLLDQNTSQVFHVPELVLMEQASMAFVQKLLVLKQNKLSTALIACGSGNNGGDGLAIARLLREQGVFVSVWPAGEEEGHRTSPSYDTQKQICSAYRIPVVQKEKVSAGEASYDVVIDALFGTGLSREISGALANDIDVLNQLSGWKVAVDIASGISSDDGAVLGTAFRADDTITFSFGKKGQYLWPGNEYCGKVHVVSMGITQESWLDDKPHTAVLEPEDLKKLPSRMAHTNKGSYGKLLIIAGSVNMSGAACFCAKAAYRMGSGLVRVCTCEQNRLILQTKVPEAVLVTGQENEEETLLAEQLQWADAVVFGPGIGTGQRARRMTSTVLEQCRVPLVLDADALNIIADQPELLEQAKTDIILTPHPGEMSRLTKKPVSEILTTLEQSAETFAKRFHVICVLKDFHTVTAVSDGMTYVNLSGNNGMATAGSGDVLAGVIGSLLAQGMKAEEAAPLGVYVHGLAGDAAKEKCGVRGMMASDIIEGLKEVEKS